MSLKPFMLVEKYDSEKTRDEAFAKHSKIKKSPMLYANIDVWASSVRLPHNRGKHGTALLGLSLGHKSATVCTNLNFAHIKGLTWE